MHVSLNGKFPNSWACSLKKRRHFASINGNIIILDDVNTTTKHIQKVSRLFDPPCILQVIIVSISRDGTIVLSDAKVIQENVHEFWNTWGDKACVDRGFSVATTSLHIS